MLQTLTDSFLFEYELLEGKDSDEKGTLKARGILSHADVPTANGRVYPGKIMEREVSKIRNKVKSRSCFGMLDHPKDGKTTLSEASHLITDLDFNGKTVNGTLEVLDTPSGKTLKAILQGGGKVGVSSRGVGTTKKNSDGKDYVQDDYQLFTWDFVADPAVSTAVPEFFREEKENKQVTPEEEDMLTIETLKENHPELVTQIVADVRKQVAESLKDDFQKKFLDTVAEQEEEVAERVRSEMLSDPEVGAAKAFVESVKRQMRPFLLDEDAQAVIRNKDEEIETLNNKIEKMQKEVDQYKCACEESVKFAESIGYRYYMEKTLSILEDTDAKDRIVALMGDVSRFNSNDEFKTALKSCVVHLKEEEENAAMEDARIEELKNQNSMLEEKLSKALQLGEALAARAYAERKIAEHPHRSKLRKIIESADIRDTKTVDSLVEKWDERHVPSVEFRDISSKLGGGISHLKEEDISNRNGNGKSGNVLGVSMDELCKLAGIDGVIDNNDGSPY